MSSINYAEEFRKRRDSFEAIAEMLKPAASHSDFASKQLAEGLAAVCELLAQAAEEEQ